VKEVYRLSIPNHDGPTLLIERTYDQLQEALVGFLDELCPNGHDGTPDVPEDGIALDIDPIVIDDQAWEEASGFEWEGFLP